METKLLPLIDGQTDPTIATYAKEGECSLRITSKRKTLEEAKAAVEEMLSKVKEIIGDYIYSTNDEELIDVVGKILLAKGITISCCDSARAGFLQSRLRTFREYRKCLTGESQPIHGTQKWRNWV